MDKTGLLKYVNSVINTTYRYLCVSRPRRFGKTTTMNMLSAYYGVTVDGADIFKDMKIAQDRDYKKHLNKYNIIKVEVVKMGLAESSVDKWVAKLRKVLMYDFKKTYPDLEKGVMFWKADNFHVYPRHFKYLEDKEVEN